MIEVYGNWQHAPHTQPFYGTYKPVVHKPQHKRYMFKLKEPAYKPYVAPKYTSPIYHSDALRTFHGYKPVALYTHPTYHKPLASAVEYSNPATYSYGYGVVDAYAKLNYGESEERHGDATTGEYRVLLPDCRTQIVKYHTADKYSGNVMEVTYEGTPC